MSAQDMLAYGIYREALKGNASARRKVIKLIRVWWDACTALIPKPEVPVGLAGFYGDDADRDGLVLGESLHPATNADRVTLLLGIGVPDPAGSGASDQDSWQLLAPWVVVEGLARQGVKLDARKLGKVKDRVADPKAIDWPNPA